MKDKENTMNIIVSHGYGVQVITEEYMTKCENSKEILRKEDFFIDYCTSYCFNIINNNIKFIGRIDPD